MGLSLGQALNYASTTLIPANGGGVPALAWRLPNNTPVLKQGGGYWLRAS